MRDLKLRPGAPLVNEINDYDLSAPGIPSAARKLPNPLLDSFHAAGQFHTGRRYTLAELEPGAAHCFSHHAALISELLGR